MPPKLRACEGPVSFGDAEATGSRTMSTRHGPRGAAAEIRLRIAILLIRSDHKNGRPTGGSTRWCPTGGRTRCTDPNLQTRIYSARGTKYPLVSDPTRYEMQATAAHQHKDLIKVLEHPSQCGGRRAIQASRRTRRWDPTMVGEGRWVPEWLSMR